MNLIGSKIIETDRLILKPQSMEEQKRLWEILCIPDVNRYYLSIPKSARKRFYDWSLQEPIYQEKIKSSCDGDVFCWSLFLKDFNICIGQISVQKAHSEDGKVMNKDIRDIGWYIDPKYQRQGYMYEAASSVLNYMFNEVKISMIKTGAAKANPASWKLMEKLGFIRTDENRLGSYTFLDDEVECYGYELTKEQYLKNRENLTSYCKNLKKTI